MSAELYKTDEVVSEDTIKYIYVEDDDPMPDRVDTHSGAWIREEQGYRWWQAEGVER